MDIYGALGLPDSDYAYINTLGQEVIYDATLQVLGDHNADLAEAERIFVESTTFDHTIKYKLPSEGMLQRVGSKSPAALTKPTGGWTVSFPLEEFGAGVGYDRVTMAYTDVRQYNLDLMGILRKDRNTRRQEMFKALFGDVSRVFKDENWPDLTVQPLANGDATVYPPVVGSMVESTANNYLASGYVSGAISDTNDPIPPLVDAIEQYMGTPTGGSKIAVFIAKAETAAISGLTNFDKVPNRFVDYGMNTSLVGFNKFPSELPGRVIGETDSALIVEWRWLPSGYMIATHLDAPQPLKRRIDPPAVGLGDGLQLIVEDMNQPIKTSQWSHRFGYGCANRLNAAILQLTAGSYTIPAQWTF